MNMIHMIKDEKSQRVSYSFWTSKKKYYKIIFNIFFDIFAKKSNLPAARAATESNLNIVLGYSGSRVFSIYNLHLTMSVGVKRMTQSSSSSTTFNTWVIYGLIVIYALCYQLQRPIEPFLVDKLVKGGTVEASAAYAQVTSFFSVMQGFGRFVGIAVESFPFTSFRV